MINLIKIHLPNKKSYQQDIGENFAAKIIKMIKWNLKKYNKLDLYE